MRDNGLKLYQANRIKQAELTPVPVWQYLNIDANSRNLKDPFINWVGGQALAYGIAALARVIGRRRHDFIRLQGQLQRCDLAAGEFGFLVQT